MHSSFGLFWNFSFLPYGTFNSSPVWIHRLVLNTTGTRVFIDGNNLINKWDKNFLLPNDSTKAGLSNSKCSEGQMRDYQVTHYTADTTMAVLEPY